MYFFIIAIHYDTKTAAVCARGVPTSGHDDTVVDDHMTHIDVVNVTTLCHDTLRHYGEELTQSSSRHDRCYYAQLYDARHLCHTTHIL